MRLALQLRDSGPDDGTYGRGFMLRGCRTTCRIDYQLATPGLPAKAVSAVVDRAANHPERWSDHAPVTVSFALWHRG